MALALRPPHKHAPQEAFEFEKSLLPDNVHPLTVSWLSDERRKLMEILPPGTKQAAVNLASLTPAELDRLDDPKALPANPTNVNLTGSSKEKWLEGSKGFKLPVYVVPSGSSLSQLEIAEHLDIAGHASDVNLETGVYDAGRNKVILTRQQIGILNGVSPPILGLLREAGEDGLLYTIEPPTESINQLLYKNKGKLQFSRSMGTKLADLYLRTAQQNVIPRGACNPDLIRARGDGTLFFGRTIFQATGTPTESLSFMFTAHAPTSFHILGSEGMFDQVTSTAFFDQLNRSGHLSYESLKGLMEKPSDIAGMPKPFDRVPTHLRSPIRYQVQVTEEEMKKGGGGGPLPQIR
jgi:hypothetical protein